MEKRGEARDGARGEGRALGVEQQATSSGFIYELLYHKEMFFKLSGSMTIVMTRAKRQGSAHGSAMGSAHGSSEKDLDRASESPQL
jgi:hypothetical protein